MSEFNSEAKHVIFCTLRNLHIPTCFFASLNAFVKKPQGSNAAAKKKRVGHIPFAEARILTTESLRFTSRFSTEKMVANGNS